MDKFKRLELIEAGRQDFNFFAALCLPEVITLEFPPEYVALSEVLMDSASSKEKRDFRYALGLPRGHAKTTWAKILVAWLFCYTDRSFALVGASSEAKGQSFIGDVSRILKSRNLTQLFGSYSEGVETDTKTLKVFHYRGRTRILQAVGAQGDPRGVNIDFKRPDIQICDDLQSRDNAKSDTESANLLEWYSATYYLTKANTGVLHMYIGNTYPYEGCILTQLRNDQNYTSFVVGGILSNDEALWPELISKAQLQEDLKVMISRGQPEVFFSEIMNDPRSASSIGFDYSKIRQWDKSDFESPMSGFIVIDVAGDKKDSDDTAIGACLIYDDLNTPYFRDVEADKLSPGETIKKALKMAVRYNIQTIFVEAVAYQSSLLYWFNFICQLAGIEGFKFLPIRPRAGAKNSRIMDSIRSLQNGEIVLHPDISSTVESQLSQFDPSRTNNKDDILDLLDYMKEIPQQFPTEISLLIDALEAPVFGEIVLPWENAPI